MGKEQLWKYWRNKLSGEHVMTMADAYSEYPDWEMTTRDGYLKWMDKHGELGSLPVLPDSPLDKRLLAPAQPAPVAADDELVRLSHALEHEASENVTLKMEIAEALGVHRHTFLDADGDEAIVEQVEALQAENARLQADLDAARAALEPFAEAWLQVPYGLRSALYHWNGKYGDEHGYIVASISEGHLQDAHTVFFHMKQATKGSGE